MAETEFEGRTEDEALQRASAALGVPVPLLDYSVIDEGSGGILGFGARSAKIRVRSATTATAAAPATPAASAPAAQNAATAPETSRSRGDDDDDTPGGIVGPAPEKAAKALEVAKALVEKMAMRATVEVRDDERDIVVTISEVEGSTDVADMLGGSRPPAVPSLQFLLNKIVNRFPEGRKHIVVEAPAVGVRLAERRAARPAPAPKAAPAAPVARVDQPPPPLPADVDPALATAARALAEKSRALGKVFTIHPMSAADRRAVHATITGLQGVQTVSEGDGLYRKIHIVPAVSAGEREDGQGKRRRRRRRRRRGGGGGEGVAAEGADTSVETEHDDHGDDASDPGASESAVS